LDISWIIMVWTIFEYGPKTQIQLKQKNSSRYNVGNSWTERGRPKKRPKKLYSHLQLAESPSHRRLPSLFWLVMSHYLTASWTSSFSSLASISPSFVGSRSRSDLGINWICNFFLCLFWDEPNRQNSHTVGSIVVTCKL
jgi:hypothetical protein